MSDYLSHLAARQLSPGEGVRPRIDSYFAPEARSVDAGSAVPVDAVSEARAPMARSRREPWNEVGRALAVPDAEARSMGARGSEAAPRVDEALTQGSRPPPNAGTGTRGEVSPGDILESDASRERPTEEGSAGPRPLQPATGRAPNHRSAELFRESHEHVAPRDAQASMAMAAMDALHVDGSPPEGEGQGEVSGSTASLRSTVRLHPTGTPARAHEGPRASSSRGDTRTLAAALEAEVRSSSSTMRGARLRDVVVEAESPAPRSPTSAVGRVRALAEALGAEAPAPHSPTWPGAMKSGPGADRPAAPLTAMAEGGPAEPVIQVTIGRIDVRAVTPPAPARSTPARPSPGPSLDEYLARRNGGGR
ncbi:hypothetical protein [Corallococcus exiguus]|uniref:hypothetical protein n=1 Tax=Corallococcus exiguus TaxID=83462 RepID=UPI00149464DF|nr:hypothetical protein [Corallococcus exiguus]NPD27114.1 hypothetical protein [Corallococcus exiguus]